MKKNVVMLSVLMLGAIVTLAQEKKQEKKHDSVPQVVLDSFAVKYRGVTGVEWEKEGKHWEAEMKQEGKEIKAIFDVRGNFMYTETPIAISELPKGVVEQVAARYPHKKIDGVGKIVDVNATVMYEVELNGISHMFFHAKGEYLNRED
jgi:hypothetical protein